MTVNSTPNSELPIQKRIACLSCRRKKLRCDRTRPECSNCERSDNQCVYELRKKPTGPKKGYVKDLEARLAKVEEMIESTARHQSIPSPVRVSTAYALSGGSLEAFSTDIPWNGLENDFKAFNVTNGGPGSDAFAEASPSSMSSNANLSFSFQQQQQFVPNDLYQHSDDVYSAHQQTLASTGFEETPPPLAMIDELEDNFFKNIYPMVPIFNKSRFYAAVNFNFAKLPIALRYALWALSCTSMPKYFSYRMIFYERGRKYADKIELEGLGEQLMTLNSCKTWILICLTEFKLMMFQRSWMSSGRASRLATMLGLTSIDCDYAESKKSLPPPMDSIEKDERRRVFWMIFIIDRFSSTASGWPYSLQESDIFTNIPTSERSFFLGTDDVTYSITNLIDSPDKELTPFNGLLMSIYLLSKANQHIRRWEKRDSSTNEEFASIHKSFLDELQNFEKKLPDHLRFSELNNDPNLLLLMVSLSTGIVLLHQVAILRASKTVFRSESLLRESYQGAYKAALKACELLEVCQNSKGFQLAIWNPFLHLSIFICCRSLIHYSKEHDSDIVEVAKSIGIFKACLHNVRSQSKLAELFLAQLEVEEHTMPASILHSNGPCRVQEVAICASANGPFTFLKTDSGNVKNSPVENAQSPNFIPSPTSFNDQSTATSLSFSSCFDKDPAGSVSDSHSSVSDSSKVVISSSSSSVINNSKPMSELEEFARRNELFETDLTEILETGFSSWTQSDMMGL